MGPISYTIVGDAVGTNGSLLLHSLPQITLESTTLRMGLLVVFVLAIALDFPISSLDDDL